MLVTMIFVNTGSHTQSHIPKIPSGLFIYEAIRWLLSGMTCTIDPVPALIQI